MFKYNLIKSLNRFYSTSTSTSPIYEFITYKPKDKIKFIEQLKQVNSKVLSNSNDKSPLVNAWETDLGSKYNDEVICFLKFNNNQDRLKVIGSLDSLLKEDKSSITCNEFEWAKFEGISESQFQDNKVWEYRTYKTKPGKIAQWEQDFTKGFETRKKLSGPVGVFNGDVDDTKAVVHLWPYKSYEHRMEIRNSALKLQIWLDTVKNTTASLTSMESKTIIPINLSN